MNRQGRQAFLMLAMMGAASVLAVWLAPDWSQFERARDVDLDTMVPGRLEGWRIDPGVVPVAPDPRLQAVVEATYDQTLSRTYVNDHGQRVMLSIAYSGNFSGRAMQYHRPEVCYPAQGFEVLDRQSGELKLGARHIPLTHLSTRNEGRKEAVSYWVTVSGTPARYGLSVRVRQIKAGLTGQMPDGFLVRVSSIGESYAESFRGNERFLAALMDGLSPASAIRLAGPIDPLPGEKP